MKMKKLQMIALAAALSVTGAHAAVAEGTVTTTAQSGWTVGSLVTAMGGTFTVVAITAGVATLAVVAANNGGSSGTTGTVSNNN